MCTPVLGAVIGGGQAVLSHLGQVQAATQRNKNRAALYNAEKVRVEHQHKINIQNYYLRGVDAKDSWDDIALEASLARQKQEILLNEAVAAAFQGMEGDYIKLQSDQRIGRYAEMSGVTARRGRTALKAAIGRAKANRQAAVDVQHDRAAYALQTIKATKDKADREARDMIGLEPERGPGPVKPKWDKGPSMLSLIVNTAIGAYSGYKMGKQLQGAKPGSVPDLGVWGEEGLGFAEQIPGMEIAQDYGFTNAASTTFGESLKLSDSLLSQKQLVGVGASGARKTWLPNNFYDFIDTDNSWWNNPALYTDDSLGLGLNINLSGANK